MLTIVSKSTILKKRKRIKKSFRYSLMDNLKKNHSVFAEWFYLILFFYITTSAVKFLLPKANASLLVSI